MLATCSRQPHTPGQELIELPTEATYPTLRPPARTQAAPDWSAFQMVRDRHSTGRRRPGEPGLQRGHQTGPRPLAGAPAELPGRVQVNSSAREGASPRSPGHSLPGVLTKLGARFFGAPEGWSSARTRSGPFPDRPEAWEATGRPPACGTRARGPWPPSPRGGWIQSKNRLRGWGRDSARARAWDRAWHRDRDRQPGICSRGARITSMGAAVAGGRSAAAAATAASNCCRRPARLLGVACRDHVCLRLLRVAAKIIPAGHCNNALRPRRTGITRPAVGGPPPSAGCRSTGPPRPRARRSRPRPGGRGPGPADPV